MPTPQRRKGGRFQKNQKNPPVRRHNYADIRPKKKKTSLAAPILILFVLALVISLIAAAAWQKLQDSASSSDAVSSIPTPPPSAARTSPSSIPSMKAGYSQPSSPESGLDSEGDAQPGEGSQSGDSSSQSSSPMSAYTFGSAVPASVKVSESYFDDALFIGDSITTGITLYGILDNGKVLASTGVNPSSLLLNEVELEDKDGNVTKANLLDLAKEESPKKIYLHIGANGVAFIGKETFISLYAQSVRRLKEDHPDAIIYVQSIFPVTKAKADADDSKYSNEKIDDYNQAIMEMAKEEEVYYLNVAEALKGPDGALPNEASPVDGMHFGPATYRVWVDYLLTHVVDAENYAQEPVQSSSGESSSESQESSSSSAAG